MKKPLYTARQAQLIDLQLTRQTELSAERLMRRAASACLREIKRRYAHATSITLVAGAGNNGGDAYALACLLHGGPGAVRVFSLSAERSSQTAAELARRRYLSLGGAIEKELDQSHLNETHLIVDALFGVGLNRPLNRRAIDWVRAINESPAPVMSVDVPSGLNADSGAEMPLAVDADVTVTFISRKRGLYTASGRDRCGAIVFSGLLQPQTLRRLNEPPPPAAWLVDINYVERTRLARKTHNSHKNDYGHVLVIGGDSGMGGAALLAAEAALRAGAGLVSLASRPQHLSACLARCPAIMCHAVERAEDLDALLDRAKVIVLGVGLGDSGWSRALCERALASPLPKVVDAGALSYLSSGSRAEADWILTPHPGEAAVLLSTTPAAVQADRFSAAERIRERYGGVCVLKGSGSIVCSRERTAVCAAANPNLATAGSGDVLSGITGALYALGLPVELAAEYAVLIHAQAGDQATRFGQTGLIATDLLSHINR